VRVHREASGELADGVVMRGARCLAWWILCVADAATKPARASGRGVGRQDPDEFSAERPDLRCETRVARPPGRGGGVRPASDERLMRHQALRARPRRRRVPSRRMCSIASLMPRLRTGDEWPTSPISGPPKGGSTSRSSSISFSDEWWAGPCRPG